MTHDDGSRAGYGCVRGSMVWYKKLESGQLLGGRASCVEGRWVSKYRREGKLYIRCLAGKRRKVKAIAS